MAASSKDNLCLSSVPHSAKASVDLSGLFGLAVAAMRQRCELQKKEGAPHPPVPLCPVPLTQKDGRF